MSSLLLRKEGQHLPADPAPSGRSRLRLPAAEDLAQWDRDQLQRYLLVAQLLDRLLAHVPGQARVLEVGSNVLNWWPQLFAPEEVHFTRCDVEAVEDDPELLVISRDQPLPFADETFDAVVSLEVLEHIPRDRREAFLGECLRVSRQGAVWTCPNGHGEVEAAEQVASQAFQSRHGRPHPFLCEHVEHGLPRVEEITAALARLDYPWAVFDNSPLDRWLPLMLLDEALLETRSSAQARAWLCRVAEEAGKPRGSIPYRKVYVCARTFPATVALEPLGDDALGTLSLSSRSARGEAGGGSAPSPEAEQAGRTAEGMNLLARAAARGIQMAEEAARRQEAEHDARHQEERERLLETVSALENELDALGLARRSLEGQLQAHRSLGQSIMGSRLWRLLAPLRWLRRLVAPGRAGKEHLLPWQQLELMEEPDTWRATGADPQFLLPCHFPAGWVRLRYRIISQVPTQLMIYADTGEGFRAEGCIEQACVGYDYARDCYLYLPRPVVALRLDPLDGEGVFQLEHFEVRAVPGPIALVHAIRGKLRLLRKYSCTLPALGRGLKLLATGRLGVFVQNIWKGLTDELAPSVRDDYSLDFAYQIWRKHRPLTAADRGRMRDEVARMTDPVLISVVTPTYNTDATFLRKAIESVKRQIYPHWELCIADDASTEPHVRAILEEYAAGDPRIKVAYRAENGHISAASNSALELAGGEYIALLDHDDELAEQALFRVAQAIHADRGLDMVYTDEDKLELDGRHVDPFFKPTWSPEYFQTCMYTCHLGVYRTALVRAVGGFRSEYDCAQDYDLALRVVARTKKIHHIPEVLYHWRKAPTSTATGHQAKPTAHNAARRALQYHLKDLGWEGKVETLPFTGVFRTRFAVRGQPLVSIVIPSACKATRLLDRHTTFVEMCLESIRKLTTYPSYEVIVLYNEALPEVLGERLAKLGARLVPYHGKFNLATKMNLGAAHAAGEQLLFLNDDTEVISPEWIESMLEYSQQPEVGAVGACLLFPGGRFQHVGVTILDGNPGHLYYGYPGGHIGYFGSNILTRNYSAVTGACMMTRKEVFDGVGGFAEEFYLNYNDVDYCLRLRERGLRIVYTPYARLYHYESVSKDGVQEKELELFRDRWAERIPDDPYYNPHFSRDSCDFRIYLRDAQRPGGKKG